jgi:hypothetical protein
MASYEGQNMSWSWRAHNKSYLRIVANEGFVLRFDNTQQDAHPYYKDYVDLLDIFMKMYVCCPL